MLIAAGSIHTYFGNDSWAALAPGLKTISEGLEIRRRILTAFETAEKCVNDRERNSITTFSIISIFYISQLFQVDHIHLASMEIRTS